MKEIWKDIDSSYYEVSNLGKIKNIKTGRLLKYWNKDKRSPNIKLVINGKRKNCNNRLLISKNIIEDIVALYKTNKTIDEIYDSIKNINA